MEILENDRVPKPKDNETITYDRQMLGQNKTQKLNKHASDQSQNLFRDR